MGPYAQRRRGMRLQAHRVPPVCGKPSKRVRKGVIIRYADAFGQEPKGDCRRREKVAGIARKRARIARNNRSKKKELAWLDYEPIEAWLIGNGGMTAEQAGWVTLREFNAKVQAWERRSQEEWERARWQMFLVMQMHPHIKKGQKPHSAQAWIRFPWEQPEVEVTKDDCKVETHEVEQLGKLLEDFKNRTRR